MDNELALRTIGYLIGYYKTHDETMINSQEIEAIDFLLEENQQLKEELEEAEKEYGRIFGLWHNRKLIKKFDDEYDEEDKKNNPERDYVYAMPDAEEVYKRYYAMKKQQKEFIDWLENKIHNCKYGEEKFADGDDLSYHYENELREEILSKYKEIIGVKDEVIGISYEV